MDGLATGKGIGGQHSFRNTPSLLNVAQQKELFWDGRSVSLEQQLLGPLTNPREHGLADAAAVVAKVREQPEYVEAFARSYGTNQDSLGMQEIADAIASYERSLVSTSSPFDRYDYDADPNALSASARRGLELFRGRAGCAGCHTIGEKPALFSDQAYHRSPQALPEPVTRNLATLAQRVVAAKEQGGNALDRMIAEDADVAELGRFLVTLNPSDIGSFRTPSLRNVAQTAPYMHDGHYSALPDVIDAELYSRGDGGRHPIALTIDERGDLLAFLQSLSSD
jgi:cytochrome c peroxidase